MNTLRLEERPDVEARCPYCLDALAAPTRTCAHCGTTLHAACRTDLARCPTQGCAAAVVGAPPPPPPSRRRATARTPVLEPAFDRNLDELARRIGANRPARGEPSVLGRVRPYLFGLALSLPGVMVAVYAALSLRAYFIAQGVPPKLSGTFAYGVVLVVLLVVAELLSRLWPGLFRANVHPQEL